MTKLPLNLCVFTTTKGHFNRVDIYKRTIERLFSQVDATEFANRYVHIKVSEDTADNLIEMREFFQKYDFKTLISYGNWAHFNNHGAEYLNDITKTFLTPEVSDTEYTLFLEDDFLFHTQHLQSYFEQAIEILHDPNVITVRFPRFSNEKERVANLMRKHNIPGKVLLNPNDDSFCYINDHSNNPFIARTRDLRIACTLLKRCPESFPAHPEHGFAAALKLLSMSETPIAVFNPKNVRVLHIGCKEGDEDSAEKELLAELI